jgi:formylglycine-generating enzyme required for sulfatase activity
MKAAMLSIIFYFLLRLPAQAELKADFKKEHNTLPAEIQKLLDDMVSVEGGTFTMGCNDEQDNDCREWEKPLHKVTLSKFSIGRYEVTQAQWRAVMGSDPTNLKFTGCDDCPVDRVSWNDAQNFINQLNQMTGKRFRLPTEAEWEYAARGGNKSKGYKYSGSNNIDSVAWHIDNSDDKTHPVGLKLPNELGIYDMSGNVWEWCNDWNGDYSKNAKTNPKGPSTGTSRVYRGGSWTSIAERCRISNRYSLSPIIHYSLLGFRLASQ